MNNRRSYLDTMNAGRRRKASTSLEEISNTLDELESRIRRPYDGREDARGLQSRTRRLSSQASYYDAPSRERPLPAGGARGLPAHDGGQFASAGIADELGALRRELRHQMGAGLRHEFDALKREIETALQSSGPAGQVAELGAEFERLSAQIHKLAQQSDDRQVNMLRLEMEQVKNALGKLAREETVQSFDRKWDEFDQRWSDIASQVSNVHRNTADASAVQDLNARLEQISEAVNALPTSVALRSLEDKMKILAATVDQFAHQQDRIGPEALDAIEERLDEISRAIAASTSAAQPATYDPQPFERIEARISSLARQLGEVVDENPTIGLVEQLTALSHRVEDIAHRVDMPEHAIERLASQIELIARKLEESPAAPDLGQAFDGLENRFASLSNLLERRHEDALVQGQNLFRDLERRLEDVTVRLDGAAVPRAQSAELLEAMDARFAELAGRLERQSAPATDGQVMRDLEARLDMISSRIETSTRSSGVDPELIRSLESQIADLTSHISKPAQTEPGSDDVRPRLDKIEQSIIASRQDVIEAARRAAEEAVRNLSGSATDGVLVAGLVDDLKSLEALTRKSDDRNAKTFEAIHDTLLKIVDRLGSVEAGSAANRDGNGNSTRPARDTRLGPAQTPSLEPTAEAMPLSAFDEDSAPLHGQSAPTIQAGHRTAAAAAAEAAAEAIRSDAETVGAEAGTGRKSMLGGLTRALSGRKAKQEKTMAGRDAPALADDSAIPSIEMDSPLDPAVANQPLEPGSGAPDLNAIMKRVRDERGQPSRGPGSETGKSDFIAAARRAAQAAAAEAEMMKRSPVAKAKTGRFNLGRLLGSRRKPVLMGVAAILMALAALQVGKSFIGGGDVAKAPAPAVVESPTVEDAIPVEVVEDAPAPEEVVRMAGEPVQPQTARSAVASVPDAADEISTDWLDVETTASAPTNEDLAEAGPAIDEITPASSEDLLASIPLEAGPIALREAAAEGDPKALFEIGNRYAEGRGVNEDMAKAAEWYEKAADHGLAPAQYRIGNLYEKGVGVARDIRKAKTWYQLAAAQGNASAMHNLAVLFAMGADGTTDNESAARWFTAAAELGVKDSQFNLGILAAKGVGTTQNLEEAYKWFALVAKAGDKDAAEKRDEVANALRPEQLDNARAAAELWRTKPVDTEANTVEMPDSWSESADTTAGIDLNQAVRNIQHILNKNGYQAGAADGIMGEKTKTAIAAFQKANDMEPTGEIDEPLVRALLDRR